MSEFKNPELEMIMGETKDFSREVRKDRVDQFKEKLYQQVEDVAKASLFIEEELTNNPSLGEDDLSKLIEQKVKEFDLNAVQNQFLKEKFSNLQKIHRLIGKEVGEFQIKYHDRWQREFYKSKFGFYPKSDINITEKSGYLILEPSDHEDYLQAKIIGLEQLRGFPLSVEEIDNIKSNSKVGATMLLIDSTNGDIKIPVVTYMPTVGKMAKIPLIRDVFDAVSLHEKRHAVDFAYEPSESYFEINTIVANISSESTDNEINEIIPKLISELKELIFRYARSEVLAFYEPIEKFTETSKLSIIVDILIRKILFKDKSSDYLSKDSDIYKKQLPAQIFQKVLGNPDQFKNYNYLDKASLIVAELLKQKTGRDCSSFVEKEFAAQKPIIQNELKKALIAAEVLGKYSKLKPRELMWLLQNEPLNKWYKLVERNSQEAKNEFRQIIDDGK